MEVERDGISVASYAYDENGNRTAWTDGWGSGTATYDAQDRLLAVGAVSYGYTDNGELATKSGGGFTTSYVYDVLGNLLHVGLPDGIAIDYEIDAKSRRIGKRIDGSLVQRFVYLGGLSPIAELDGAGNVTTQYVYATGGTTPDFFLRGGATYRIFTDHLGSPRVVVNAETSEVVQRLDYDAFGRITYDSNPGFQPFAFAGGLYDPQTGLTRFGARDYDPEVGRWTAKDPIGFAGGSAGLYEYVVNDPLNRLDPSGLQDRYAGMMREYVDNPELMGLSIQAAGYALVGLAVMGGAAVAVEATPLAIAAGRSCYLSPSCQEFVIGLLDDTGAVSFPAPAASSAARTVEQYALKAVEPGFYPVMTRGFSEPQAGVWLEAGEVWKYGTTRNPGTRYSQSFLDDWSLRYETEFAGSLEDALLNEKGSILGYVVDNGALPPGNKIVR